MRSPTLLLALAVALVTAGCAARGNDDPFAYMQKPIHIDKFDLAETANDSITRQFWVTDGSIKQIQIQVWVNNTAGDARVVIKDPAGYETINTTASTMHRFGLNLGAWSITVSGSEDAAGDVGVVIVRS